MLFLPKNIILNEATAAKMVASTALTDLKKQKEEL